MSATSKVSPSQWFVDIEAVGEYLQEYEDMEHGGEAVGEPYNQSNDII